MYLAQTDFPFRLGFEVYPESNHSNQQKSNGDEENRTPDFLLAKQALYQLSYIPLVLSIPYNYYGNGWLSLPEILLFGRTWIRTKDLSFIRAAL